IPEVELGYDIRRDHWNQGLATEAATAVRDHAMDALGLRRLVSLIRAGNGASCRVAEKIGMRRAEETTRYERRSFVYRLPENRHG
ncbi:MAG TPA: GNAT family N-acetyltransferase, partial [bacterium]